MQVWHVGGTRAGRGCGGGGGCSHPQGAPEPEKAVQGSFLRWIYGPPCVGAGPGHSGAGCCYQVWEDLCRMYRHASLHQPRLWGLQLAARCISLSSHARVTMHLHTKHIYGLMSNSQVVPGLLAELLVRHVRHHLMVTLEPKHALAGGMCTHLPVWAGGGWWGQAWRLQTRAWPSSTSELGPSRAMQQPCSTWVCNL